jgi:hypothetical protein
MIQKALFLFLSLFLFLALAGCDDDQALPKSCEDNSYACSSNILLGTVLVQCIQGKWYIVRECTAADECPETENCCPAGALP